MISITYFNWAKDNQALVSIKIKNIDANDILNLAKKLLEIDY